MTDLVRNRIANGFLYLYMAVIYGQSLFDFGSDLRKDIYFIGTAACMGGFFFAAKNFTPNFIVVGFFGGIAINEILFQGDYDNLEIPIIIVLIIGLYLYKKWKD